MFRIAFALVLLAQGPDFSPRPTPSPLSEHHRRWLAEEAVYLISDAEKAAFEALPDEATRDAFQRAFWEARDPTPGTARNERRDEHLERIAQANRLFGQGRQRPGWSTPRGKIWIQLGPPRDRTSYPMERSLYPIEDWFYQGDPELGLPTFFHVLFYRPNGVGDYEIYDPVADGPEKLVGGSPTAAVDRSTALAQIDQVSGELALTSLSLIPSDPIDIDTGRASPASSRLVEKLRDFGNHRPVDLSYIDGVRGRRGRVEVEYSFRSLGMRGHFHGAFTAGGGTALHYAVEIPPGSLTLQRRGDRTTGALQVAGRVFTRDGSRPVFEIDEHIEIDLSPAEFEIIKASPFAFEDNVPLLPGEYQANLVVRNLVSKEFGVVDGRFDVPAAPAPGKLALSPLLVAARSAPAVDSGSRPFVFAERSWYPAPDRSVAARGEVEAVFQVAYPAAAHALGDQLAVRYAVLRGEEEKVAGFERIKLNPAYDHGLVAGVVRANLAELEPGEYRLHVAVSGGPGETAVRSDPFRIRGDVTRPAPWVYLRKRVRSAAEIRWLLATQALARGEEERGLGLLDALVADPEAGNIAAEARLRLAERRLARGEWEAAIAALAPLTATRTPPGNTWALLGVALGGAGRWRDAAEAYEKALAESPRSTRLLNALGEALDRSGAPDRAVEALRRSLEIDPAQPKVKEALARLAVPAPGPPVR